MTPLEMLIHGIESGDMGEVAKGFNAMTTRNIVPKTPTAAAPIPEGVLEALAFYANRSSYSFESGMIPVMLDEGGRANDALSLLNFAPQQSKPKKKGVKPKPASPPKASKKKSSKPATPQGPTSNPVAVAPKVKKWEGLPTENKFETELMAGKTIAPPTKKEALIYKNVDLSGHGRRPPSNGNELIETTCEVGHRFSARRFELEVKNPEGDGPKLILCPHCRKAGSGI